VVSLDSFGIEPCSFVKVDVDGKELQVLRSASHLIEKNRPVLYFENDNQPTSGALLDHAMSQQYDLYWHPAPIFDPNNFLWQSGESLGSQKHCVSDDARPEPHLCLLAEARVSGGRGRKRWSRIPTFESERKAMLTNLG
jgi:hypothetical protein